MSAETSMHTFQFQAMGSTIEVALVGGTTSVAQQGFAQAIRLAKAWESVFSRFRQESELSLLNRSAGRSVRVSDLLFSGVAAALGARQATEELFDPTVLPALMDLGYDRSFEHVSGSLPLTREHGVTSVTGQSGDDPGANVQIDADRQTIALVRGTMLDLGGIAKGMYADALAHHLSAWSGGVFSAGGDLRVWGTPPDGDTWVVGVEDPTDAERDVAVIEIASGAVATSGRNRRTWQRDSSTLHHLIDPRSGQPAEHGLRTVSVVADTATAAEVAATAVFVSGAEGPLFERLKSLFTMAVVVRETGEVQSIRGKMGEPGHGPLVRAA
jgi:thiamine biosynthesis lipoprotein